MAAPLVPPCRDLLHALRQLATRGDASAQANASSAAAALLLRFVQGIGEGRGKLDRGMLPATSIQKHSMLPAHFV